MVLSEIRCPPVSTRRRSSGRSMYTARLPWSELGAHRRSELALAASPAETALADRRTSRDQIIMWWPPLSSGGWCVLPEPVQQSGELARERDFRLLGAAPLGQLGGSRLQGRPHTSRPEISYRPSAGVRSSGLAPVRTETRDSPASPRLALKFLIPSPRSCIRRGNFPAPKTIKTTSRTTSQCTKLSAPNFLSSRSSHRDSSTYRPRITHLILLGIARCRTSPGSSDQRTAPIRKRPALITRGPTYALLVACCG